MFRRTQLALISALSGTLIACGSFTAANATPPVTSGLTVSLDAQNTASMSGTTWSGQDGTTPSATVVSNSQFDATNHWVGFWDGASPLYATLGTGTNGDAITPQGDMTLESWVYFGAINSTSWNIVATRWFNGTGTADYHFGVHLGKLDLYTAASGLQDFGSTSSTSVTAGWHQIAFTIVNPTVITGLLYGGASTPSTGYGTGANNIGIASLYLDGALYLSKSGTDVFHVANSTYYFDLGDRRVSTPNTLAIDGYMEKFRLYNRALSAAEINQNYRADSYIRSLAAAPYNTAHPAISGPATYTFSETSTSGTWRNGVTSYSYQWSRAATANGTYTPISGATNSTYLTTSADVGNYLEVAVGATNSNGTIYDTSTASPQIAKAGTTLSLTSASQIPVFRATNNLTANTNGLPGKVSFTIGGKAIPGCKVVLASAGNSYNAVCPWKPSIHAATNVVATFTPSDSNYLGTSKGLGPLQIVARSGNR